MQDTCRKHLQQGLSIGFVPTMGALHDGHLSLIKRAQTENNLVVVSIFINPIQFGPAEDFATYPRDIDNDIAKIREIGIDAMFIPDNKLMYTSGFSTYIQVDPISDRLCGSFRPGHFRGVATVVAKLLNIVAPTRAYFGQKDFQQTVIIKRIAKDLNFHSEIVVCPTVREKDGLAMSSRNRYLNPAERSSATAIFRAITTASEMLQSGSGSVLAARELLQGELKKEALITGIDYASVFDSETLEEAQDLTNMREVLIAVAVRMGRTRLIDNMPVHL